MSREPSTPLAPRRRAARTPMGVLLSGTGRTLENFVTLINAGQLPVTIPLVVSNRSDAYGLVRARSHGLPTRVIRPRDYPDDSAFSAAIAEAFRTAGAELIAMAGFLKLWHIPPDYRGRVLNVHPALLPSFCGLGFYGDRVHQAVFDSGVKVSGCTVHFADEEYDHGPIIVQKTVAINDADDPHTIADKVFALECEAYPEAIRLFCEGRLVIEGRRVRVRLAMQ
ncbi:MAG: phosphoribosylglycinamide formyltransferase [Planctomycetota bacterium]